MSSQIPPADGSQILSPLTFPLSGARLIEASAGTGKTYTIAVLYLRLVLGHGAASSADASVLAQTPLMPPQILVSTFTQAAVDELRERIRARLHEAAQLFLDEDAMKVSQSRIDPLLLDLRAQYTSDEARRHAARRLVLAADWMDEAAIFTIHGWCQRMLIEHAFHSRSLYGQTLLTDMASVTDEAVQDYWRIHVYPLPPAQQALVAALLGDPATLLNRVRMLLSRDDTPIWLAGEQQSLVPGGLAPLLRRWIAHRSLGDEAEAAARQAWIDNRMDLSALLIALHPGLNKSSHRSLKTEADMQSALIQIDDWAERGHALDEKIRNFLVAPRLNKGFVRAPHRAWSVFAAWQAVEDASPAVRDELQRGLWAHAGLWLRARIDTVLQTQGRMGFEDLLVNLDRALSGREGDALARTLRQQFPIALIDEFQDTDALQFRIFDRVFGVTASNGTQAGTLILIGDPKQSIYRFRGADMRSYLSARAATAGRHYTLADNYRSTPALVNAVNHVFGLAESWTGGAFGYRQGDRNPVPFVPVAAKGRARLLMNRGKPEPALTGWILPGAPRGAGEFVDAMAEHCATAICQQIRGGVAGDVTFQGRSSDSLRATTLQPRDMAVLVSNGTQAAAVQQALSRRGVRSVYLSDRHRLFAAPEAGDFYLWLRAMAEPRQLIHVRSALTTRSFCRSLAELDAIAQSGMGGEDRLDEEVERFLVYREIWQTRGVLAAVYRLMHDYGIPARLLTSPAVGSSGERRLTNLLHLADWAQNEQAELAGIDALVQRFQQALMTHEAAHELRLEQDENLVQIITIHSAKGLQYPVVYVPFLCLIRPSERSRDDVARVRHIDMQRVLSIGADSEALEEQRQDDLAEGLRLVYVALTRAESACVVGLGPVTFKNKVAGVAVETALSYLMGMSEQTDRGGKDDETSTVGEALARWAACTDIRIAEAPRVTADRYQAPEPRVGRALTPRSRHFQPWRISSFSGLTHALHEAWAVPETPEQANTLDAVIDSRTVRNHVSDEGAMPPGGGIAIHPLTAALDRLPRGARFGTLLHQIFELAGGQGFSRFETRADCAEWFGREPDLTAVPADLTPTLTDLLHRVLNSPLPAASGGFRMRDLRHYQIELEFWLPVTGLDVAALDALLNMHIHPGRPRPALSPQHVAGQLKGFMDLVFEADGRYYVLDYKSNWLGASDAAYQPDRLVEAMLAARYDLQMALYLTALHRHLQDRLPDYDYARDMGGAHYLFVRGIATPGHGVYFQCPDRSVIDAIDRCLSEPGVDRSRPSGPIAVPA